MAPKTTFDKLSPVERQIISQKGGQASQAQNTGHSFGPQEARAAGRKGGKTLAKDRMHMSRIGRKGGQMKAEKKVKTLIQNWLDNTKE